MRALLARGTCVCVYASDRTGVDEALARARAAGAETDALALHEDLAEFVREREMHDWLARRYADGAVAGVLVTTDASGPRVAEGESSARARALVHYDFPRDANAYRARFAGAFANDDDDDDGRSDSVDADDSTRRIVVGLVAGAGEARRLRDVADALRLDISELPLDVIERMRPR